jgi:hypothetical protein
MFTRCVCMCGRMAKDGYMMSTVTSYDIHGKPMDTLQGTGLAPPEKT